MSLAPIEEFARRICVRRVFANVEIYGSELDELELSDIGAPIKIEVPDTLKSLILRTVCVNIDWRGCVLPASLIHMYGSNARRFPVPMEHMPNVESIAASNIGTWGYIEIMEVAASLRKIDCDNISSMVKLNFDGMPQLESLYLSEVRRPLTLAHTFGSSKLEAVRVYDAIGEWDFSGLPDSIKSISLVNADPVDFAKIKCPENAAFMEVRGTPPKFRWS
jgi:hypothetical protein